MKTTIFYNKHIKVIFLNLGSVCLLFSTFMLQLSKVKFLFMKQMMICIVSRLNLYHYGYSGNFFSSHTFFSLRVELSSTKAAHLYLLIFYLWCFFQILQNSSCCHSVVVIIYLPVALLSHITSLDFLIFQWDLGWDYTLGEDLQGPL